MSRKGDAKETGPVLAKTCPESVIPAFPLCMTMVRDYRRVRISRPRRNDKMGDGVYMHKSINIVKEL